LTIDQLTVPRRKRKRSLAELFYATCILHSRYYDPLTQCPCTLEEVITYLKTARDEQQVPSKKSRA
jgi:capsule polysaccharide export protein KpsC/LpsZ